MASKYEDYDKDNICHMCKKKRQAPRRKCCFDCLEKARERAENQRKKQSAKSKAEYLKSERQRIKVLYQRKREKGQCVKCSREATHGIYCYEHYIQVKRKQLRQSEERNAARR